MSEYTQGVCADGAAILKNGTMMTIEEILSELRLAKGLEQQNAELIASNEQKLQAMNKIRDDLLLRADIDSDGKRAVNVSSTVWLKFCEAIDQSPQTSLAEHDADVIEYMLMMLDGALGYMAKDAIEEYADQLRNQGREN